MLILYAEAVESLEANSEKCSPFPKPWRQPSGERPIHKSQTQNEVEEQMEHEMEMELVE